MKSENHTLIKLSPAQSNPYLCRPEDFKIEFIAGSHGQTGENPNEHKKLILETHEDPLFSKWSNSSGRSSDGRQIK
jgi:hypothetical protein